MKQKSYIWIITVILVVIVASIFIYLNYSQNQETDCNWEPGLCKNICGSQNYYYDGNSKECKKYVEPGINKGCCTPPPFETLQECKSVCE